LRTKLGAYQAVFANNSHAHLESHHSCRLGKWYEEGVGKKKFSTLPSYQKLDKPHAEVHEELGHAIEIIKNNQAESKASELIAYIKKAEAASKVINDVLDALLAEKAKQG
jgi:hypothetical protein